MACAPSGLPVMGALKTRGAAPGSRLAAPLGRDGVRCVSRCRIGAESDQAGNPWMYSWMRAR